MTYIIEGIHQLINVEVMLATYYLMLEAKYQGIQLA